VPETLVSSQQAQRLEQLKRICLSYRDFEILAADARKKNAIFLSTPFDLKSAEFLNALVPAFKIASGDNNFFPLIDYLASTGKPLIVSTGMALTEEMMALKEFILHAWETRKIQSPGLAFLHCVSSYPTQPVEANVRAVEAIKNLGVVPGYSDHTLGILAPLAAVSLGAKIIEKHFTLDKNQSSFRDHQLSLNPDEFLEMVLKIREIEVLLGDGTKKIGPSELAVKREARRSIVASRDLEKGAMIASSDLEWLRPGHGLEPGKEHLLVGQKIRREIRKGESLNLEDLVSHSGVV
ncbi:MAG: hypothetical protein EXS63_07660, partial [Candidatus Omnitrophica bacterium]|nr:hypothetical protein [Candidatus Omnitrophota bacterium]